MRETVLFCLFSLSRSQSSCEDAAETPDVLFVGNDIRYTPEQLSYLVSIGQDTTGLIQSPADGNVTRVKAVFPR